MEQRLKKLEDTKDLSTINLAQTSASRYPLCALPFLFNKTGLK